MESVVHFWCPDDLAAAAVDWDPDAEPDRFGSGVSHALVELYARLARAGASVELGETSTLHADLVAVPAGIVRKHAAHRASALRAVARAGGRVVLIRSDTPLDWRFPIDPTVEVMPYSALVRRANQRWIPQLPQRGLIPRSDAPMDRIRTVAIKCNPISLPDEVADPAFGAALAESGVRLWIDMPSRTDGADQRWHDFSDVDAVLCVRSASIEQRWLTAKPATRLINSWVAGCLPICAREPAYVELAEEGADACFVDDVADVPSLVYALNGDPARLARLHDGARRRGAEFATERVLERWQSMLEEAARRPRDLRRTTAARVAAVVSQASSSRERAALGVAVRVRRALASATPDDRAA